MVTIKDKIIRSKKVGFVVSFIYYGAIIALIKVTYISKCDLNFNSYKDVYCLATRLLLGST